METISTADIETFDPLQHLAPLPHERALHPLGFPLILRTNSPAVLDAAAESFAGYEPAFDKPSVQMRVLVADTAEGPLRRQPVFRGCGESMVVAGGSHNFALSDFERNSIHCFVERRVVEDRTWFRVNFLESTVLSLLTARYLVGVHAACIAIHGRGILLHAPSGTGKSCLAYACGKRGWTYVCDDASFLLREAASRRVIGRPQTIKLLESAVGLFPELAGIPAVADPRGENALFLDPAAHGIASAVSADAGALVFLRRERGPAGFSPMDPEDAWQRLVSEIPVITPQSYQEQKLSARRLVDGRIAELRYWTIQEAVGALDRFAAELA